MSLKDISLQKAFSKAIDECLLIGSYATRQFGELVETFGGAVGSGTISGMGIKLTARMDEREDRILREEIRKAEIRTGLGRSFDMAQSPTPTAANPTPEPSYFRIPPAILRYRGF